MSMMDLARFESEQFWIHQIQPSALTGVTTEADAVMHEIDRQRTARGLWYPTMVARMPALDDLIVQTLARNPLAVDKIIYALEHEFRCKLKKVTEHSRNKTELREVKQAVLPFLSSQDHLCPSCMLGFETRVSLSRHLRAPKCLLHKYPKHSALLHWVFQRLKTKNKIQDPSQMSSYKLQLLVEPPTPLLTSPWLTAEYA